MPRLLRTACGGGTWSASWTRWVPGVLSAFFSFLCLASLFPLCVPPFSDPLQSSSVVVGPVPVLHCIPSEASVGVNAGRGGCLACSASPALLHLFSPKTTHFFLPPNPQVEANLRAERATSDMLRSEVLRTKAQMLRALDTAATLAQDLQETQGQLRATEQILQGAEEAYKQAGVGGPRPDLQAAAAEGGAGAGAEGAGAAAGEKVEAEGSGV